MIKSQQFTVETEAILLTYAESVDSIRGQTVAVANNDASVPVYLGGADVSTSNGYKLAAGAQLSIDMDIIQDLYAISGSSVLVSVLWANAN